MLCASSVRPLDGSPMKQSTATPPHSTVEHAYVSHIASEPGPQRVPSPRATSGATAFGLQPGSAHDHGPDVAERYRSPCLARSSGGGASELRGFALGADRLNRLPEVRRCGRLESRVGVIEAGDGLGTQRRHTVHSAGKLWIDGRETAKPVHHQYPIAKGVPGRQAARTFGRRRSPNSEIKASYRSVTSSMRQACATRATGGNAGTCVRSSPTHTARCRTASGAGRTSCSRSRAATHVASCTGPKPRKRSRDANRARCTRWVSGIACHSTVQTSTAGSMRPNVKIRRSPSANSASARWVRE